MKNKGEKEIYTHLTAEFQRIGGEIRKSSSVINIKIYRNAIEWERRALFKKIRDTKGTFHTKMGSIKDRNCRDLTEAEDIKRWQKYTEKYTKKS